MATGKSTTLSNLILDGVLGFSGFSSYAGIATTYIALFTGMPGAGGTSPSPTEVPFTNNYSRVALTNNLTNWPAASAGLKSNGTAITFATASGSWGTIVGFGIYDQATGGDLLYFGNFSTFKTVASSDIVSFSVGNLQVTES